MVTGRGKTALVEHFDIAYELEATLHGKSRKADLELLSRDLPEAGQASFTRQQSPLGLGHAVWCAREIVAKSESLMQIKFLLFCVCATKIFSS